MVRPRIGGSLIPLLLVGAWIGIVGRDTNTSAATTAFSYMDVRYSSAEIAVPEAYVGPSKKAQKLMSLMAPHCGIGDGDLWEE